MENNFYVYIHFRKDNLQPFYVGKGKNIRFKEKKGRNEYWKRIVNKYGYFPQVMENNLTEEQAFVKEKFYIEVLGRENLCNMTDGGEGTSGVIRSQESKKKMSESMKGEKHNMYGKKHTEETKKKMSESRKGKKYTEELKKKIANSLKVKGLMTKKVINIKTNEIYESAKEVSFLFNIKYNNLIKYLTNKCKNKTDFKYL